MGVEESVPGKAPQGPAGFHCKGLCEEVVSGLWGNGGHKFLSGH